jgi:hypothetical protein
VEAHTGQGPDSPSSLWVSSRPGSSQTNIYFIIILFCNYLLFDCLKFYIVFYSFVSLLFLSSTVSQQLTVSKKIRLGPKVCSQAWWIDKIKNVEGPKYFKYWTHYSEFEIGQFRALAEYDYFILGEGIETQGAPDFGLNLEYPIKLVGKPFWVDLSTLVYKDYRLWTWIQVAKTLERPLSDQTITWFNYFSIESNQVEAKELLAPFRKENQKKFDIYLEWEHNNSVYHNTNSSSTI